MREDSINKSLFNKQFRNQLRDNPTATISELNNKGNNDIEFKVLTNTKDTVYVVLPSKSLQQELNNIAAAGETPSSTAGSLASIGSVGSASTASTIGSCLGSASSAGSIGSVGTASSAACT